VQLVVNMFLPVAYFTVSLVCLQILKYCVSGVSHVFAFILHFSLAKVEIPVAKVSIALSNSGHFLHLLLYAGLLSLYVFVSCYSYYLLYLHRINIYVHKINIHISTAL